AKNAPVKAAEPAPAPAPAPEPAPGPAPAPAAQPAVGAPAPSTPAVPPLPPADPGLAKALARKEARDAELGQIAAGGRADKDQLEQRAARNDFVFVREYAHAARPDRRPGDRVDFAETLYWNAGVRTDD